MRVPSIALAFTDVEDLVIAWISQRVDIPPDFRGSKIVEFCVRHFFPFVQVLFEYRNSDQVTIYLRELEEFDSSSAHHSTRNPQETLGDQQIPPV